MSIENPGSLREFASKRGVDPSDAWKVAASYSRALQELRESLASELGTTLDALHDNFVTPTEVPAKVSPEARLGELARIGSING